jgi:hypothetical protein
MKTYTERRRTDLLWAPVAVALSGDLPGTERRGCIAAYGRNINCGTYFYLKA